MSYSLTRWLDWGSSREGGLAVGSSMLSFANAQAGRGGERGEEARAAVVQQNIPTSSIRHRAPRLSQPSPHMIAAATASTSSGGAPNPTRAPALLVAHVQLHNSAISSPRSRPPRSGHGGGTALRTPSLLNLPAPPAGCSCTVARKQTSQHTRPPV